MRRGKKISTLVSAIGGGAYLVQSNFDDAYEVWWGENIGGSVSALRRAHRPRPPCRLVNMPNHLLTAGLRGGRLDAVRLGRTPEE